MKVLMSGNEAIARGAYEAGVRFAAAYPGTPSTEILERFCKYEGVYAEWSTNEKVAVEVAIGAALAGEKALAVMKHVGVNVAADPIFTVSYTGISGALVIISADDPSMHSSQNEQDNRNYARFAKIPMLEPADAAEAKKYIKLAFAISKKFDTPVFLRSTTRVSHSKSVVDLEDPDQCEDKTGFTYNAEKYVMVPINARTQRVEVEKRERALKEFVETFPENKMEINDPEIGIITAGMPYNYAKDVFPDYSYLKLGMVYPLPEKMILDFASKVKKIYVVEELDPYLEEQIKALGIRVIGKEIFPYTNEFDPGIIKNAIKKNLQGALSPYKESLAARPPNLCPGCPHRGLFYALRKQKAYVHGDIGCYTLSYMKPLEGLHSCICMGASIGMAHGMSKAMKEKGKGKVVGVIGDSTFLHSGITSLLNMAYNQSDALIIILDNSTTAMTGMQEHPGTGYTLMGTETKKVNLKDLVSVLGIDNIKIIDPMDQKATRSAIKEELGKDGPSVIISQRPCALFKRSNIKPQPALKVDTGKCEGCRSCIDLNCPPISWKKGVTKEGSRRKGVAFIDESLCNGCGLCAQVCKFGAIS
ncbi:MAG: indolepyruvate ferredoxin oxidoreductase subunit alpha [Smithella sp.]|nr:indolepyruvate ferredoxin oxidoreductase subunit alpha [Smithella sp.]MDM7985728.1 indolepyruvate ferredoxin oxidoreductase subunit alpha [Smithella sp.]HOU50484.1 indolepyruvate ferredoxin oxidoreductase subunit alpha [Smithella sp.]HQI71631.1 indolepyruvate ferredoxin oxidoreductase subunit alpha [Smithella sp.]